MQIERLDNLPPNFDQFAAEVAGGFNTLYGPAAQEDYLAKAQRLMMANIRHPAVDLLGVYDGEMLAAMLLGVLRAPIGEIPFIHVLKRYAGRGLEQALVEESVKTFRNGGVEAIVSECVPLGPLELEPVFQVLGFEALSRQLMISSLYSPELTVQPGGQAATCPAIRWPAAAACIVDAYQDHPGRRLHVEVRHSDDALDFLHRVAAGAYGTFEDAYIQTIEEQVCEGIIVGCQSAPGIGFVLQCAVRRACQKRGHGAALIRALARAFRNQGLDRIALGVTLSNPALRLYQRLGFESLRKITAFTWWR